jgi:hypothetical protein
MPKATAEATSPNVIDDILFSKTRNDAIEAPSKAQHTNTSAIDTTSVCANTFSRMIGFQLGGRWMNKKLTPIIVAIRTETTVRTGDVNPKVIEGLMDDRIKIRTIMIAPIVPISKFATIVYKMRALNASGR